MDKFDVVVIGSGPGGYVAAIRAAQLGMTAAVIEKDKTGGVCLNVGCIPTKALLASTHILEYAHTAAAYGVTLAGATPDLPAMMKHKDTTVTAMTTGVSQLLKANGCAWYAGDASVETRDTVAIKGADGKVTRIQGKNVLIATGSSPIQLPHLPFDHTTILDSTSAMNITSIPASMAVIGAGAVGLEFAAVYSRLGTKVTVYELMARVLPGCDGEISDELKMALVKRGLEIVNEVSVSGAAKTKDGKWSLTITPAKGGATTERVFDRVLVAVGRRANTSGLGLEKIGVTVRLNSAVIDVQADRVTLKSGEQTEVLPAHTILWGAGVQGSPLAGILAKKSGAVIDRAGRVQINPDCTLPGRPEVFVLGDMTCFLHQTGKPLPGVAPVATQMGSYVADLITRRLQGKLPPGAFHYNDRGSMATIGRASAIADTGRLKLSGYLAWLVWLFIHIVYLIRFENRVMVLFQWGWNYVTRGRTARLITEGSAALRASEPSHPPPA